MTITLTREEAQQVHDALLNFEGDISDAMFDALTTLRARLAQSEPEPVAGYRWEEGRTPPSVTYTAPPKRVYCSCGDGIVPDDGALCGICVSLKKMREWQGLTDEEVAELCHAPIAAIEAKLKEKNG